MALQAILGQRGESFDGGRAADSVNAAEGVEQASHLSRLPGAHVHGIGASGEIPAHLGKERLQTDKVDPICEQGG